MLRRTLPGTNQVAESAPFTFTECFLWFLKDDQEEWASHLLLSQVSPVSEKGPTTHTTAQAHYPSHS